MQCVRLQLLLFFAGSLFLLTSPSFPSPTEEKAVLNPLTVRIGVLAKRGKERAIHQWQPTIEYLSHALPEHHFELVPLDFDAIDNAVCTTEVDFILSNPAYFVNLEHKHSVRAITTLIDQRVDQATALFGGVIFCRSDRQDITHLSDIKHKRFMAVDPRSFGGWHVAWYHLLKQGIYPQRDFAALEFGGTHDAVVYAIRDGHVDAGTVRTDTLERMAQEGKIKLENFRILDPQKSHVSFPFMLSTALYPEWPMASLPHVSDKLIKRVAVALLQMPKDCAAAHATHAAGWTVALNYQPVHDCLRSLRQPPYTDYGKVSWLQAIRKQWALLSVLFLLLLTAAGFSLRLKGLNKQLSSTLKQLDEELHERRKVEATLSNFKETLDQVHDCVFIFDAKTLHFMYANQGAVNQVGYSTEELAAMTPLDVIIGDSFQELINPLLHKEKNSVTVITDYRRKDGSLMPVEMMLQYVVPGNSGRFVAVVRDINKRLQEQKEKEKLQARLLQSQKLESVGRLAAGIAHEINTPIQFISSNVEFLDESFQDIASFLNQLVADLCNQQTIDMTRCRELQILIEEIDWKYLTEEIPKAIGQSKDGLKRVSSIVQAMKEFSHPGSKEKVMVNLNKIIETTVTVARNEWRFVADVTTNLAHDLPMVPCLTDEMGQVILNILVNAAHAIAIKLGPNPNGKKGTILISTRLLESYVELRIQDSGNGMPPEVLARIFEPFFTTKEVGSGTGQGLAISHDVVVDKHGGTMDVETEEGSGTAFIITLPLDH